MALYLMSLYGDPEQQAWFRGAWTAAGERRDMGKSCVQFVGLADAPLAVAGEAVQRVAVRESVARYEALVKPASGWRRTGGSGRR